MTDVIDRPAAPAATGAKPGDKRPDGMPVGRPFAPGVPNGPGRKAIPDWLRGKSDELLRLQHQAATLGVMPQRNPDAPEEKDGEIMIEVPIRWRMQAIDSLLDRIHGKAPVAQEPAGGQSDVEELILRIATSNPPPTRTK